MPRNRPTAGQWEERTQTVAVDGRRIRSRIPYSVESRDLGGFREVIEPGALRGANLDELVATVNHTGVPIGRHPTTLEVEDRADGLHWSVDPPQSRQDVIEAVTRGDLQGASWRMRVARDHWDGDVRHIDEIAELRDVSIVTHPAYENATVEMRDADSARTGPGRASGGQGREDDGSGYSGSPGGSGGRLRADGRTGTSGARRSLAELFRDRGFPGEVATISWDEFEERAVTWSASVDVMNQVRRMGGPLGLDQRYAWPAFGRIGVDASATSVAVVQQTARSLATAANVVRAIDATTAKPETASTLNMATVSLKQVATIQTGVPNTYLLQPSINTIVEQDLRLAINEGLDKLVLDNIATAGFQAPGSDILLVSIRKAVTTLRNSGYSPDTLLLTPAADEAIDLLVSGISGGTADFVFGPGVDSESALFGCERRISKTIPASAVVDSGAFGNLYASPVSLARFENLSGTTNTSNIRLELNACFGLERVAAAVRIAAS